MSDVHQWTVQIGEEQPPSEIPWTIIAIGGMIAGGLAIALALRRKTGETNSK